MIQAASAVAVPENSHASLLGLQVRSSGCAFCGIGLPARTFLVGLNRSEKCLLLVESGALREAGIINAAVKV